MTKPRKAAKPHTRPSSSAVALRAELLALFVVENLTVTEAAERLGYDRTYVSSIRNSDEFRAAEHAARKARHDASAAEEEADRQEARGLVRRAMREEALLTPNQWRAIDKFIPNAKAEMDVTSGGERVTSGATREQIEALVIHINATKPGAANG